MQDMKPPARKRGRFLFFGAQNELKEVLKMTPRVPENGFCILAKRIVGFPALSG
jgi:hypothetical protein